MFNVVGSGDPDDTPYGILGWDGMEGSGGSSLTNSNRTFNKVLASGDASGWCWLRYGSPHTGKRIMELLIDGTDEFDYFLGLVDQDSWGGSSYGQIMGSTDSRLVFRGGHPAAEAGGWVVNGLWNGATQSSNAAYDFDVTDVISLLVDYDNLKVWFAKNGVPMAGDPLAGTGNTFTLPDAKWDPAHHLYRASGDTDLHTIANFRSDHIVYPFEGFEPYPEH